jgi:hypothetical protein
MTIRHMRIAYWTPKSTNTHSEYVILIDFPLQQWLRKRSSMLRYTYSACLCFQIAFLQVSKPAAR